MSKFSLEIGIIGAGFSGTSLAINVYRLSKKPIRITLIDSNSNFGIEISSSSNYCIINNNSIYDNNDGISLSNSSNNSSLLLITSIIS